MTKKKNWLKLISVCVFSILFSILIFWKGIIDVEKIALLGEDFQYNIITMSATIGGFLFTGVGILISAIDKPHIKRLWDNYYLDNLYRAAFLGITSNIVTIISAFMFICEIMTKYQYLIYVEITSLIIGIIFFCWCIKKLLSIMKKMKNKSE